MIRFRKRLLGEPEESFDFSKHLATVWREFGSPMRMTLGTIITLLRSLQPPAPTDVKPKKLSTPEEKRAFTESLIGMLGGKTKVQVVGA